MWCNFVVMASTIVLATWIAWLYKRNGELAKERDRIHLKLLSTMEILNLSAESGKAVSDALCEANERIKELEERLDDYEHYKL